ncbi:MAG: DUF6128 domain-containing protein [Bacteroidales bacterium]|nr:DUF6128 domain-containing protein [Clostridium sp.]MCM1204484.1 DUF6128 domain-containing protein [Bacteroidales bacterium]
MGQVQSYKRKITYFYQFHNGNVGSTAGFLKLEIRGDKVKIIINIQEPPGLPYQEASLYFYHEAGDHLSAVKVDEIESVGDVLAYQNRTDWQQLFDTGRDLYTFDGVAVVYNDDHYYIGDFRDKDRKGYELVRKENRKEPKREYVEVAEELFPQKRAEEQPAVRMLYRPMKARGRVQNIGEGQPVEPLKEVMGVFSGEQKQENAVEPEEGKAPEAAVAGTKAGEGKSLEAAVTAVKPREDKVPEAAATAAKPGEKKKPEVTAAKLKEPEPGIPQDGQIKGMDLSGSRQDIYEKCEDCPYHKKRREQKEQMDAFEKMIEEYPKLPIYGATELFDCVRIHPRDIGKLDMRNWKLGVNSFLSHGFYTYQYLLLGKMRFDDGTEHGIIGVPGVFSSREKYLANMFGFEQFIPVKKTGVKTGEFGYWIVEISPCLS